MERYFNQTGDSGITHYECGADFIRVKYKKELLEYNTLSNSQEQIDAMKVLAKAGSGLYRYIRKNKIKEVKTFKKEGVYQRMKLLFSFV